MDRFFDLIPYEKLTNAKSIHFILGGFLIGLVFFSIYYFSLYSSTQEKLAQLNSTINKKEQTLKTYRLLAGQRDRVSKELVRTVFKLDGMKQQMPKGEDMPDLLKRVADFGRDRGVFELLSFKIKEGKVKDFYKEIPVVIHSRGSFWDMLDFMDSMQNLLQLVNLSDLKMEVKTINSSRSGRSDGQNVTLVYTDFVAKTFAYIEGAEAKPVAAGKNG